MNNKTPREMRTVGKRGDWTSIINKRKRVKSSPGVVERKRRKKHRGLANKERCWPIGDLRWVRLSCLCICMYVSTGMKGSGVAAAGGC